MAFLSIFFTLVKLCSINQFTGKLLVTTGGYPNENGFFSEVIDLINEDSECEQLESAPFQKLFATGGLIKENIPLVCGGNNNENQCFIVGQNKIIDMAYKRDAGASLVFNNKVNLTKGQINIYIFSQDNISNY